MISVSLAPLYEIAGLAFLRPARGELRPVCRELREALPEGEWLEQCLGLEDALEAGGPLDLEKEYLRLFLSPAGAPCPPWQSVHAPEPQLMGDAHHSALAWFREEGFEPQLASEPADHVGLLLLFYAHLLDNEAAEERLGRFRREHLLWMIPYCARLEAQARHPFYGRLAAWTARLLGEE